MNQNKMVLAGLDKLHADPNFKHLSAADKCMAKMKLVIDAYIAATAYQQSNPPTPNSKTSSS